MYNHLMDTTKNKTVKLVNDVLVEIMCKLPSKSFFRFKCLSKWWLALSSYPEKKLVESSTGLFYQSLLGPINKMSSSVGFIGLSADTPAIDASFSFLPCFQCIHLLDCTNGLILCYARSTTSHLFVCNPATRRWVTIESPGDNFHTLALAFNPKVSKQYHILQFVENINSGYAQVLSGLEVFSSSTGKWTQSQIIWESNMRIHWHRGKVLFKGMIHLLEHKKGIVAVDQEGKAYERFPSPAPPEACHLEESGGHLVCTTEKDDEVQFWILEEKKSKQWILKHRFSLKGQFVCNGPNPIVLAIHQDLTILFLRVYTNDTLFSYNIITREFREVCTLINTRCTGAFYYYVPCYMDCPSLGSP